MGCTISVTVKSKSKSKPISGNSSNSASTSLNGSSMGGGGGSGSGSGGSDRVQYFEDFISYQKSCLMDPNIRTMDIGVQERTIRVLSTLNSSDLSKKRLSLEALAEITGSFVDMNRDLVNVFLDTKLDIWKNPDLSRLVREYFDNTDQTLEFCTVLEKCLKKAMDGVVGAQITLNCFKEEDNDVASSGVDRKYNRTLEELRRFSTVIGGGGEEIFSDEFFKLFESVRNKHVAMLDGLGRLRQKLGKKLASTKTWRKVTSAIFIVSVIAILICSVVAASLAAPPVAAALAAATSVPIGSLGKWVDSCWKSYDKAIKDQDKVVGGMQIGGLIVETDLENIKMLVDGMKNQIENLVAAAEFGLQGDEDAVRLSAEEIKRKVEEFREDVENLRKRCDRCIDDTRKARTVILKKVMENK